MTKPSECTPEEVYRGDTKDGNQFLMGYRGQDGEWRVVYNSGRADYISDEFIVSLDFVGRTSE